MAQINTLEKICLPIGAIGMMSLLHYEIINQNADMFNDFPLITLGALFPLGITMTSNLYREALEYKKEGKILFFSDIKYIYKDIKKSLRK